MSRIDDLIAEKCPRGVPFKLLGDLVRIASERVDASSLTEATYVGVDNLLPNFGGRKDAEYGSNSSGAIRFGPGDILIGNIRPYLKKVWLADREGGASPDVLTIALLPGAGDLMAPRFLYYLIASDAFVDYSMRYAKGAKMPRGDKAATMRYRIPVPPRAVQSEIVATLDNFKPLRTELEAGLAAELNLRSRQRLHYRRSLLSLDGLGSERWIALGDLASVRVGQAPARSIRDNGQYPFVNAGTSASGSVSGFNTEGQTVTIPSRGQGGVGIAGYQWDRFWCGPLCYRIRSIDDRLDTRFLYHFLKDRQDEIRALQQTGGTPALNRKELVLVKVPLPARERQDGIVAILDKLDALVNDLSIGLPAEIAARRKQYEYYRDKLLTFEEAS